MGLYLDLRISIGMECVGRGPFTIGRMAIIPKEFL